MLRFQYYILCYNTCEHWFELCSRDVVWPDMLKVNQKDCGFQTCATHVQSAPTCKCT